MVNKLIMWQFFLWMWNFFPIYTLAFYSNILPITWLPTWNPHKIWLSLISLSLTRLPWPPLPKPCVLSCARVLPLATVMSVTLKCVCPCSFPWVLLSSLWVRLHPSVGLMNSLYAFQVVTISSSSPAFLASLTLRCLSPPVSGSSTFCRESPISIFG